MNQRSFLFALLAFFLATLAGCAAREVPDPCKLMTVEEIRRIAPDVTSSRAVDPVDFRAVESPAQGAAIKTCVWRNGSDVNQVLLTSKAAGPDPVEPALKKLLGSAGARVIAVPAVGPDAAAAFYGSGKTETLGTLIAQNGDVFLDLRPLGTVGGEKSPQFAAAAALVKTALDRSKK